MLNLDSQHNTQRPRGLTKTERERARTSEKLRLGFRKDEEKVIKLWKNELKKNSLLII